MMKKSKAGKKSKAKPVRVPAIKKSPPQSFGKDPGARFVPDDEPDNPFLGIMNKD